MRRWRSPIPTIEIVPPGGQASLRGAAALRAWMEPDAFEEQRIEPLDFRVEGDKVLVRQHAQARGAGSGIELDVEHLGRLDVRRSRPCDAVRASSPTRRPKPSKPPGCRSRRCRRRTWRSCGAAYEAFNRGDLTRFEESSIPRSIDATGRRARPMTSSAAAGCARSSWHDLARQFDHVIRARSSSTRGPGRRRASTSAGPARKAVSRRR